MNIKEYFELEADYIHEAVKKLRKELKECSIDSPPGSDLEHIVFKRTSDPRLDEGFRECIKETKSSLSVIEKNNSLAMSEFIKELKTKKGDNNDN